MSATILAVLADGSEDLEAVGVIDTLRRCGAKVTVAGLEKMTVRCAHGMILGCDCLLAGCEPEKFDALFLPGGLNGTMAFYQSELVEKVLKQMAVSGKVISAICAAPIVLAKAGVLAGKRFTMYPGFEQYLGNLRPTGRLAERDGISVTGKGPGAIFAFSKELAASLGLEKEFQTAAAGMFVEI